MELSGYLLKMEKQGAFFKCAGKKSLLMYRCNCLDNGSWFAEVKWEFLKFWLDIWSLKFQCLNLFYIPIQICITCKCCNILPSHPNIPSCILPNMHTQTSVFNCYVLKLQNSRFEFPPLLLLCSNNHLDGFQPGVCILLGMCKIISNGKIAKMISKVSEMLEIMSICID